LAKSQNYFLAYDCYICSEWISCCGAGSIIGIEILDAIILAGTLGVVKVAEDLSRAFLDDGVLTLDEINQAFSKIDRTKK